MLASGSFTGFVASDLLVRADAAATSKNIVASELALPLSAARASA
jgi:hypothetical protein